MRPSQDSPVARRAMYYSVLAALACSLQVAAPLRVPPMTMPVMTSDHGGSQNRRPPPSPRRDDPTTENKEGQNILLDRRACVRRFVGRLGATAAAGATAGTLLAASTKSPARAALGAAELDLRYYARGALNLDAQRDLFDRREPRAAIMPPPTRPVDEKFAGAVLAAASSALRRVTAADLFWDGEGQTVRTSDDATRAVRGLYEAAAMKLVVSRDDRDKRVVFSRRAGDAILAVVSAHLANDKVTDLVRVSPKEGANRLLDAFAATGWIEAGSARWSDDVVASAQSSEDDDDDDDEPRALEVTLRRPVSGPAAAALERRGVIWHPDFVGLALASYFRDRGFDPAFDEYLLDDTYRTDPRAFEPSSTLLLFPLVTT